MVAIYKEFASRLIAIMKERDYIAPRSPSGICMKTLAEFAGASEQICRRYIRGDALPDYEKTKKIASHLNVTPGWLLFGEASTAQKEIDEELLHYILKKTHRLYSIDRENDYADFVLGLIRDVRQIETSNENLAKVIDLAISSISTYEVAQNKHAVT